MQSPSKLPLQPTPLENIVEEEEIDREAVIEQLKVSFPSPLLAALLDYSAFTVCLPSEPCRSSWLSRRDSTVSMHNFSIR